MCCVKEIVCDVCLRAMCIHSPHRDCNSLCVCGVRLDVEKTSYYVRVVCK